MKHISLVVFLMFSTSGFLAQPTSICKTKKVSKEIAVAETSNTHQAQITNSVESFNHDKWNMLLKKHVSNTGHVNYKQLKQNTDLLKSYISLLGENAPTDSWTREAKLAYWINAYNALTVDLIIRNYPLKSIKDVKDPWKQRSWKLGETWYSLNDIEHEILRKMSEPRIHFAIVCASVSCPKLLNKAYTTSNLEAQLTQVTKEFLADPLRNTISKINIKLSKIFSWFAKDFKHNGTLIDFLNLYTDTEISNNAKKSFKEYNWDLNE